MVSAGNIWYVVRNKLQAFLVVEIIVFDYYQLVSKSVVPFKELRWADAL